MKTFTTFGLSQYFLSSDISRAFQWFWTLVQLWTEHQNQPGAKLLGENAEQSPSKFTSTSVPIKNF